MRPMKNHKHIRAVRKMLPVRIRTRHVAKQFSLCA